MSDTAGYSKRIYKKKYKQAVTRIADRKKWISEVTNGRMNDIKQKQK